MENLLELLFNLPLHNYVCIYQLALASRQHKQEPFGFGSTLSLPLELTTRNRMYPHSTAAVALFLTICQRWPSAADTSVTVTGSSPQVCAINDFQNILDRNSLAFTRGTVITVLEQNPNGIWKGKVDAANGQPPAVGTFPASFVQPCRPGPQYGNLAGKSESAKCSQGMTRMHFLGLVGLL